ncbi:hypothetical protein [Amycolatopsis echigonensis]|uniref:hypothetical protein n=1 Tax=Amycolatopsis echigonensis TaxID=2576905 RepID=UPI00130493A8|nr:hypothetical protein [Amycolatopsis niigatensis]
MTAALLVTAEGVRTLIVFARHCHARGKLHLGTMLVLFGVSLALRAPATATVTTEATGVPNLAIFVRGACSLGTVIGSVGLLELSGWAWLRLRYALAVVAVGTCALAWLAFGGPRPRAGTELLAAIAWIGGAVPGVAFAAFTVRIRMVVRQAPWRVCKAGALTIAGCLVCTAGVVASLVAVTGGPDLTGGSAGRGLVVQSAGGLLIAAGSCFGEAVGFVEDVRRRLENVRVRRLWRYVEPIRRAMTDRLHAGGVPVREIIDIYDSLLLARQQNCGWVRERAVLVAEAVGFGRRDRAEFIDAVELRASVKRACRPRGRAMPAEVQPLNLDVENDPLDVDVAAQRAQVARLAKLVLRNGTVRRTASYQRGGGSAKGEGISDRQMAGSSHRSRPVHAGRRGMPWP